MIPPDPIRPDVSRQGQEPMTDRIDIVDQANIVKPKDFSDEAIRQAALETASRLQLFAKTWPEFYAFGLAVKALALASASASPQQFSEDELHVQRQCNNTIATCPSEVCECAASASPGSGEPRELTSIESRLAAAEAKLASADRELGRLHNLFDNYGIPRFPLSATRARLQRMYRVWNVPGADVSLAPYTHDEWLTINSALPASEGQEPPAFDKRVHIEPRKVMAYIPVVTPVKAQPRMAPLDEETPANKPPMCGDTLMRDGQSHFCTLAKGHRGDHWTEWDVRPFGWPALVERTPK